MTIEYQIVESVYKTAREIRDQLAKVSEDDAAKKLSGTMNTFWTKSSEALGEIKLSLLAVRETVEQRLSVETLNLLDIAIKGADELWHGRTER